MYTIEYIAYRLRDHQLQLLRPRLLLYSRSAEVESALRHPLPPLRVRVNQAGVGVGGDELRG